MYKKEVLGNGLTLITDRRAMAKIVVLIAGLKVGSINEDDRIAGITHFIEHMLFKSNLYRKTKEIEEELEDGGAEVNAFTDQTEMFFYIKSLPSKIQQIVEIVYQATTNLNFEKREFWLEKRNILSELSLFPEQPMNYAYEELFIPTIFRGTLLSRCVAGTPESVKSLKISDLVEFKKKWFTPGRMVVMACGKFDEKELREKIMTTFGTLGSGNLPVEELRRRIKNKRQEVFRELDNIEHAYMHMGYIVPGLVSRDINKLNVLASILGGGLSSRLFHELRDKRGLGYAVDCSVGGLKRIGIFSVSLTLFEPTLRKIKMASKVILDEFEKLKTELVDEKELQRAKDSIMFGYYGEIERIEGKAIDILQAESLGIPYGKFRKFPLRIQAISARDIMAVANKYFGEDYTLTALVPKGMVGLEIMK